MSGESGPGKRWRKSGVEIREGRPEYAGRGMQMDNKPSSRPPSTYGISPVTSVLLVYAACISGASHQERNVRGDSCSRRNLEDSRPSSIPFVPFYAAPGIKEIPFFAPGRPLSPPPFPPPTYRECRRILLEFSSSRKVDNSHEARFVRGKPRNRPTIYYVVNFECVIFAVYK